MKLFKTSFLYFILPLFGFAFFVNGQVTKPVINDSIKTKQIPTAADSLVIYKGKFKPYKTKVHASYYAEKFNGRKTACGKIYHSNQLTAAHKTLPFGTKVKVYNPINKKSVVVEITDRGPFVKGREIDLSRRAFLAITSNSGSGFVNADLEILHP